MNKIERAIYDAELELLNLERQNISLIAKIKMNRDHIETLKVIQNDKSIPFGGESK